ncbi:hypothetical protein HN51_033711 [Arachis hypogaea]
MSNPRPPWPPPPSTTSRSDPPRPRRKGRLQQRPQETHGVHVSSPLWLTVRHLHDDGYPIGDEAGVKPMNKMRCLFASPPTTFCAYY